MAHPDRLGISWEQLGWRSSADSTAPFFSDGPISILVIAPWCPDCHESMASYARELQTAERGVLVGEFAPVEEIQEFARMYGISQPTLFGQPEKSEECRNAARFGELRRSFGDDRKWGVPLWIEANLKSGRLLIRAVRWAD